MTPRSQSHRPVEQSVERVLQHVGKTQISSECEKATETKAVAEHDGFEIMKT